ncbi:hypothetical protein [Cohnella boryungensis]|uniref:Glycosyl hydrolase family 32 n=1 Tax=Cohnella boryungensis TaxID=768479 RepID=A0ABV8SC24_9BACL
MKLYNHVELPAQWPPRIVETTLDQPPSKEHRKQWPDVVNIALGRQLFVDDFLIETTDLNRVFHQPTLAEQPVFVPETPLEMDGGNIPCACPFNDGIFYDDEDGKFKMWYQAGWFDGVAYAESNDGIHWTRLTEIDATRANDRVIPEEQGALRDGAAVWIDYHAAEPDERYKMMVFFRKFGEEPVTYLTMPKHFHDVPGSVPPKEMIKLYKSANGIDWAEAGETGMAGDNSTFFYNPFTRKWVFSLRTFSALDSRVRTRGYYETEDFFHGTQWKAEDIRYWARTDIYDRPDPELGYYTQLYNLDATPYESLMLGVYTVFLGPPNTVCERTGSLKITDLKLAFSRDGFHWERPTYEPFIASSKVAGRWDNGYAHSPNGVCLVVGDELYMYVSMFSGVSPNLGVHEYAGGSLGLAKLRRDGFSSLTDDGQGGSVTTKKLIFSGDRLFVNADAAQGKFYAEVLDEAGEVIPGFSKDQCEPIGVDSTCVQIRWIGGNLEAVANRTIKLRFYLEKASLYAFWITADEEGRSGGYMAAGGPGFHKGQDVRRNG